MGFHLIIVKHQQLLLESGAKSRGCPAKQSDSKIVAGSQYMYKCRLTKRPAKRMTYSINISSSE